MSKKQVSILKRIYLCYHKVGDSMKSRMEKYETKNKVGSRTERNKELYNKINEDETYTNIEGVISTPVKNEIDIKKLQETIEKHEEAIKDKKYTQPKDLPIMNMKAKENPLMEEDDD